MMLRLMGFLLGSAVALIALLIFTDRPGRYQVAFRYLGDAERQSKLAEIAAMTDLRLQKEIP